MSQLQADALTAEVVAEYLRDHPDFFYHRQDLIEHLSLPVRERGAVSLVEVQLKRQRDKIADLEEEITELMSIAASNDHNFHQFMTLQEEVLQCHSITQVLATVDKMARSLSLRSHVRLIDTQDSKLHISQENWQRFSINHFNGKSAYLGRLKKADRDLLFSSGTSHELGSFVVLPLLTSEPLGLIAFSSEDGGYFQPNMDTLFLRHFATLLSHKLVSLDWGVTELNNINVLQHTTA